MVLASKRSMSPTHSAGVLMTGGCKHTMQLTLHIPAVRAENGTVIH